MSSHFNNFRSHPVRCAHKLRGEVTLCVSQLSGNSEIGQFDYSMLGGQYVGTFDISVNNALSMEIFQSNQHLLNIYGDKLFRKRAELLDEECD